MKRLTDTLEAFLELGGTRKEIILLIISGAALFLSIFHPVRQPSSVLSPLSISKPTYWSPWL